MSEGTCSVPGCERPVDATGLCNMHYLRKRRFGEVGPAEPMRNCRPRSATEVEAFWARVDKRSDDECWPWIGKVNDQGYGLFSVAGHRNGVRAHRYAYELLRQPIPEGLVLDHVCHSDDLSCNEGDACLHRRCCNPWHAEPVSRPENFRRGRGPQYKPTCRNGHPWTEESSKVRPGGGRKCCICDREQQRERRRKRRAASP